MGQESKWVRQLSVLLLKKVLSIQLADSMVSKGQDNFTLMSGSSSGMAGRLGSAGFSIRAFTSVLSRMTILGESEFLPSGSGQPEKVFLGTGCGNRSLTPGPRNRPSVNSLIFCWSKVFITTISVSREGELESTAQWEEGQNIPVALFHVLHQGWLIKANLETHGQVFMTIIMKPGGLL